MQWSTAVRKTLGRPDPALPSRTTQKLTVLAGEVCFGGGHVGLHPYLE